MSKQIEALKLALKALKQEHENYRLYGDEDGSPEYIHEAIKALEEALASEQDQGEPVAWIWKYANGEEEVVFVSPRHIDATHVDAPSTITPLYTTPQPKQEQGEPVAWYIREKDMLTRDANWVAEYPDMCEPLYTTPQQRTWVGLNEEDDIDWEEGGSLRDLVEAVEAKLKELNT